MRTKYIHSSWINQNSAFMEDWKYLMFRTRIIFRTQSNIYDGDFFVIVINGVKPLTILAEKNPLQMFIWVLNVPLPALHN